MLACTALVGCSDDVIDNIAQDNNEVKKMDTYVTISIDASTSSSRATTVDGDEHNNAEHSGHENAGSDQENAVNEVLVILTKGTYEANKATGIVEILSKNNFSQNEQTKIWTKNVPYRMDETGNYKALVVINPVSELRTKIESLKGDHASAYTEVCNFSSPSGITTLSDGKSSFMMANREAVTIIVDESHNSPDNAAGKKEEDLISVERAASKITFRWKPEDTSAGTGVNVYPVTVKTKAYKAKVEQYWYMKKDAENNDKYYYAKFNLAKVGTTQYYILLDEGKSVVGGQLNVKDVLGVFVDNGETHNGRPDGTSNDIDTKLLTNVTSTVQGNNADLSNFIATLTFNQEETTSPADKTYYIKLEQYALTNLSTSVYTVRHVSAGEKDKYTGDVETMNLLGNDFQYLIDPYSGDKSGTGYDATKASTWFTHTLTEVETEANSLGTSSASTTKYFKPLPGSYSNSDYDSKHNVEAKDITPEYTETGAWLAYCNENAVLANKQVKGLVTGIVFVGKIYSDESCTKEQTVQKMYKYDNIYYETLRALLNANPGVSAFASLTENSSDSDAKAAGIVVYNGGTCFYYSSQIEHYDNDTYDATTNKWTDNGLGIMENAIMRNNIYSLSVKTLGEIGSATLELEGDESTVDQGAYITMQAKILPWIVRFNDIEF